MQDLYFLEIKEKKAAARNFKAGRATVRHSRKSMLPSDFMSARQLKEYTKGGELKVSNIYDQIITLDEYNALEDKQKKAAIEHWRIMYSAAAIKKAFGWNDYTMYKEIDRLGVHVQKRRPKKNAEKKKEAPEPKEETTAKNEIQAAAQEVAAAALQILPARQSGSTFFLDDVLTTDEAISKLMKYASFLEGEKHNVKIRLEISEIKEEKGLL